MLRIQDISFQAALNCFTPEDDTDILSLGLRNNLPSSTEENSPKREDLYGLDGRRIDIKF